MSESMSEVGELWHEKMLPNHFERFAMMKYNYAPRSRKYMARKEAGYTDQWGIHRAGHNRPLVWSGDTERSLKSSATITANSKGVTVKMLAQSYFYAYHKDFRQPDKAAEATRISYDESARLERTLEAALSGRLDNINQTETTVITG